VYYARAGEAVLLLLWGGSKRTQSRDITRAVEYWNDYQQRL
jgi:putative addiction module killer protein